MRTLDSYLIYAAFAAAFTTIALIALLGPKPAHAQPPLARAAAHTPASALHAQASAVPANGPMASGTRSNDTQAQSAPTVVVVKVAKPWYVPDALIVHKMRGAIPQYAAVPGLSFKIFTLARPGREFGGVYLWQDRASADAWFGPAWHERVRRERGVEADVRMFDASLAFSTPAADVAPPETLETAVVTLLTVPVPPNADRAALREGFVAAAAIERKAPGLLRKYALLNDERMGGAYLWRDEASARAWFDARWQATMRERYGVAPQLEWLDAPILLPSTAPANLAAERALFRQAEAAGAGR